MSKYVIDVNVVLVLLGIQGESLHSIASGLYSNSLNDEVKLLAPEFLLVELINVLIKRYKLEEAVVLKLLQKVKKMNIRWCDTGIVDMKNIVMLMSKYDLTAYDAQYLFHAIKNDCKLITTDPQLVAVEEWCISLENINFS